MPTIGRLDVSVDKQHLACPGGEICKSRTVALRRLILMFYPRVFGMFLLGFTLGRLGVFQNPPQYERLLRALSRWGLLIGLPASILFAAFDRHEGLLPLTRNGFVRTVFESIGTPLLCLGYVAWTARVFQSPRWHHYLLWFAPVGRMALSNYLSQSVLGILLFYGIGAGLFMRVSLATSLGIAVGIFAVQGGISRFWLSHFAYGPAEWVWRQLTYGKRMSLR